MNVYVRPSKLSRSTCFILAHAENFEQTGVYACVWQDNYDITFARECVKYLGYDKIFVDIGEEYGNSVWVDVTEKVLRDEHMQVTSANAA